jgi:thiosulfate dehydrogenase [quinone] large subunit
MGAVAMITLPAASGADSGSLHRAATLQLRTANGDTFNVAVRAE